MPYRKSYRRPVRRTRRPVRFRKKTVYNNAKRVKSLENKVRTLTKHEKVWGTYKYAVSYSLTSPFQTIKLMDPSVWGATFGNPSIVENTNQFNLNSITLNMSITPGNEMGLIDMTIFIVSARKENAAKVLQESSSATSLISNTDYIQDSYGTGTILNLDRWKVHAMRKVYTRKYYDGEGDEIPTPTRRLTFKIPWKTPLKSGTGNWRSTITALADINPSRQLYVLVFNNNSGLNLGFPSVYTNTLYSGYAIA